MFAEPAKFSVMQKYPAYAIDCDQYCDQGWEDSFGPMRIKVRQGKLIFADLRGNNAGDQKS